jgi:hypothetical protein
VAVVVDTEIKDRVAQDQAAQGVPVAAAKETAALLQPIPEVAAVVDCTVDKHQVVAGQMAL